MLPKSKISLSTLFSKICYAGSEALIGVVMKNSIFGDKKGKVAPVLN
jgi:hypothetical protein